MSKRISRRQFLENIGVGTAAGTSLLLLKDVAGAKPATNVLPSRTLGRTGAKVSILAFGCGSRFLMYKDEDSATAILNRAIDSGITYLDTAYAYGDGESESPRGQGDGYCAARKCGSPRRFPIVRATNFCAASRPV
jgi:Predicted oxidoreductases (related to aryl-alcohol dehydrogenases)